MYIVSMTIDLPLISILASRDVIIAIVFGLLGTLLTAIGVLVAYSILRYMHIDKGM